MFEMQICDRIYFHDTIFLLNPAFNARNADMKLKNIKNETIKCGIHSWLHRETTRLPSNAFQYFFFHFQPQRQLIMRNSPQVHKINMILS